MPFSCLVAYHCRRSVTINKLQYKSFLWRDTRQLNTTFQAAFIGVGGTSEGIYIGDYVATVSGRYDLSISTLEVRGTGLFGAYYNGVVPFSGEVSGRRYPPTRYLVLV
eukprot:743141-Rhodomonas_salina.3